MDVTISLPLPKWRVNLETFFSMVETRHLRTKIGETLSYLSAEFIAFTQSLG